MVVLKFTGLLLLLFVTEMASAMHKCMNKEALVNCTSDNPRVRIAKDDDYYKLLLCFNDTCIGDDMPKELDWKINCDDVCHICESLFGSRSSCTSDEQCENQVDTFLNSHCESAELTNCNQEMTIPITTTVLTSSIERQSNSEINNSPAVVVLGTLFGTSMVVLAVVTAGWVYTCLIVKKREVNRISQHKHASTTDYEEKYLKNPTYGGIASTGGSMVGGTTYETVNTSLSSQEIAGNYDVLNQGQTIGQTTARDAQSTSVEGNYSQLGPHDHEHVNKQ